MRIAYIVADPSEKFDGVNKKILNTVSKWNNLGYDSKLFIMVNKDYVCPKEFQGNELVEIVRYKNKIDYYLKRDLTSSIRLWNPDVFYVRSIIPYYSKSFRDLCRDKTVIQEINTNDIGEITFTLKSAIKKIKIKDIRWTLFYLLFRKLYLKKVDGFVLLNNELKNIIPSKAMFTVIGDGIDLSQYPIWAEKESYENKEYNVVFMGTSLHPWYGLEKIIYLANSMPYFNFHFIGLEDKDIYNNFEVKNKNVHCYGFLEKASYEKLLRQMDVAIGSLSLHVNNMSEGSPLKGREYLAYGLPTIIGYKDTDFFNETPEFILELPSSKNNVKENLKIIEDFIKKSKKIKIIRKNIQHLDYEKKEKKRLSFIKKIWENKKVLSKKEGY